MLHPLPARAILRVMLTSLLLSALITSLVVNPASTLNPSGGSLCGVTFRDTSELRFKLKRAHGRFSEQGRITVVTVSKPTSRMLWWLPHAGSPSYPAVACVEKSVSTNNALVLHPSQVACRGTDQKTCEGIGKDIERAKF